MLFYLYIKKGSINNANNYKSISCIEVLSKIFISILNNRVTSYVEAYSKLTEYQAEFRAGYCTIDNAFILFCIVSKYLQRKRKPDYLAFIDFQKAFNSVNRSILYEVLSRKKHKKLFFSYLSKRVITH